MRHFAILTIIALTCAASAVNAQTTVYNNGNPDLVNGYISDTDFSQFIADDFSVGVTTTFDTVRWYGVYSGNQTPTQPDAFTIGFHDTAFGVPVAAARAGETFVVGNAVNRVNLGANFFGTNVYQYEATLAAPVSVVAGAYGIEIVNDTTADTDDNWAWLTSTQTGAFFSRANQNNEYNSTSGGLAFQLINSAAVAVPESGTVALLLPALGVLGAVIARRRLNKG